MGKPITVVVGPLASAGATVISLSQKAAGARNLVLNGANGSFGAATVCASQTPGGAGALTLNGTLAVSTGYVIPTQGYIAGTIVASGTAYVPLAYPQRIYITGGSDESGKTFVVTGYGFSPNGGTSTGPYAITETITGPNASIVSSSNLYTAIISIVVSAGTAGAITVGQYGTATNDKARRVIITSGGNDTGITFALAGTDINGAAQSETITGASGGAASSVLSYKTVTSIRTSGAVATTVTVGTNGVAESQWVRFDDYAANAQTTIAAVVSGTVNYDIQTSMDDPNDYASAIYQNPSGATWIASLDTAVVGATATKSSYFTYTPLWARVLLNSGTGTVTVTFRQAYLS